MSGKIKSSDVESSFFNSHVTSNIVDRITSMTNFDNLTEENKSTEQMVKNIFQKRDFCNQEAKFVFETRNIVINHENFVQKKITFIDGTPFEDFKRQIFEIPQEYLKNETIISVLIEDNLVLKTNEQICFLASEYTKIIEFLLSKFVNVTSFDLNVKTSIKQSRHLLNLIYSQLRSNKLQKIKSVLISTLMDNFDQPTEELFCNMRELKEIEISYDHFRSPSSFENMEILIEPLLNKLFEKNLTLLLRASNWPIEERVLERLVNCIVNKNITFRIHGDLTSSLAANNFHNILIHRELYEKKYVKSISIELFDLGHENLLHEALKLSENVQEVTIIIRAVYMYGLLKNIGSIDFDDYKKFIKDAFNFDYLKTYKYLVTLHFAFQHWEIGADFDEKHDLLHKLKRFIFECIISGMPPHISKLSLDNIPKNPKKCISIISKYLPNVTKFFVSGDRHIESIDLREMDALQYFVMRGKYSVKLPKNTDLVVIYPLYSKQYESDEDLKKYSQYQDDENYYSHLREIYQNELRNFNKDGKIDYIVLFKNPFIWTNFDVIDKL